MRETKENNKESTAHAMRVIHGDNRQQENSAGSCLAFAEAARLLGEATRGQGLVMPSFRSPPREVGRRRTLARYADGLVTVSVMVRNRVWEAVLADMIEGVVVTNQLDGIDAEVLRDQLWEALEGESAQREAA
jgi:hypothetical protein